MTARTPLDAAGMALRNLGRHRVKTIITATAIAISAAAYIFVDGWILGMNLESRRNIVSYEMGAAKVQTSSYYAKKDELPMYENFGDWEPLAAALAEAGYDSAPRFVFSGTLYSRAGTAPMLFNAVDRASEERVLRYVPYLEAGRFPVDGRLELAVGSLAAEKLRVGIPTRPTVAEFEEDILACAATDEDAAFIRGLYRPVLNSERRARFFSTDGLAPLVEPEGRLALKADLSSEERERLWGILSAAGRMDVRISTVIDMKAAPDSVRKEKFENELAPSLSASGLATVKAAYRLDPVTGDYILSTDDEETVRAVLQAMLAADYPGALRHVNQIIDAVVVGVVNSPNPKTNGNVGFLPLSALQDETGLMLEGRVTELLVRKAGADDSKLPGREESADVIRAALEQSLAAGGRVWPQGMEVRGWRDYCEDYLAAAAGDNVSSRLMILFLFILSFIGISNTMLMAILERTKETGMLRALGMTDGQVLMIYTMEAGLIGAIGSILGVLIGCLVNIPMVAHGIDYSALAEQMSGDFGYRIVAIFRSTWNPPVIAATGVVATILSAVSAVPPTLRALRMPVTESLRFE